jgi:N-carbamoylputrescine amidase
VALLDSQSLSSYILGAIFPLLTLRAEYSRLNTSSSAQPRSRFTIGLIQMAVDGSPEHNLQRAIDKIEEAARAGAEAVCLPELFQSRYFCQREDIRAFDLAETVPGPTTNALGEVARRTGTVVIAPIFEKRAAGMYHNSAAVIDADGSIAGLYRKMHIPDDPAYYEKFYFTPGDIGFCSFDTRVGKLGPLICWDQWYPEGARLTALMGASILLYPTAIGWHPHEKAAFGAAQRDAWRTVQRGHAIANGVYVAAVNRIGHEIPPEGGPGIEFWGSSFLADPQGIIMTEASVDREEILLGEVDLARIEDVRRNWPFLRDRRIDAYSGITQRFLSRDLWNKKE